MVEVRFGSSVNRRMIFVEKQDVTTVSIALFKWLWCVKGESEREMKVCEHNSDSHST